MLNDSAWSCLEKFDADPSPENRNGWGSRCDRGGCSRQIIDKFVFVLFNEAMHVQNVTLLSSKYPTRANYPFSLPVFQSTERMTFETPVTLFAGENGSGKSTLLQAMANACGIHIWQETGRTRYNYNPNETGD